MQNFLKDINREEFESSIEDVNFYGYLSHFLNPHTQNKKSYTARFGTSSYNSEMLIGIQKRLDDHIKTTEEHTAETKNLYETINRLEKKNEDLLRSNESLKEILRQTYTPNKLRHYSTTMLLLCAVIAVGNHTLGATLVHPGILVPMAIAGVGFLAMSFVAKK